MEDRHSMNSPRRILSFSKRRRATVWFLDPDNKASSGFGPKTSEVYGFVGSITTVVATSIFLFWAYVPEPWLHAIGISYYPSRYWALAVPAYAMVTIVCVSLGILHWSQFPIYAIRKLLEYNLCRELSNCVSPVEGDEQPIEPISDIGIHKINVLMFNDEK